MHTDINYTNRLTPKFDAVQDIIDWLGKAKYDKIAPEMSKVENPKAFSFYCMLAGIQGFPVIAWYEAFHGEGSWKPAWEKAEAEEKAHKEARAKSSRTTQD